MINYKLGEIEMRFTNLIWKNEPIPSGELVRLAELELAWKKSTTYTIIRKLCDKGILQNLNGIVSSKISKIDYMAIQSRNFVDESFSGSLPKFISAFISKRDLNDKEIAEIEMLISNYKEGE